MSELLSQILGPLGALVLAVVALRYQTRTATAERTTLRQRYEQEIEHLRGELDAEQREHLATRAALQEEHRARLRDARSTTETLLALTDRVHATVDLLRTVTPGHRRQ
jgi:Skp family chaperone for outer membrane proteins